ncbi:hypothetical protein [Gilvibacter sp.]|uniref:hypothetical protein n=1 Tax=Gilvibacter sp. TaxID=2729997 RepID=UPI003F4A6ED3
MKRTYLLPIFLLLFYFNPSWAQTCTRLDDISQTANNNTTSSFWEGAAQSWTSPCSGQIESIELRTATFGTAGETITVDVFILQGTTTSPIAILKSFEFDFEGFNEFGKNQSIPIPGLLDVTAGTQYTFALVQPDGVSELRYQYTNTNPYDGGNYSRLEDPGEPWVNFESRDLDFDIKVKDDRPTIACRNITLTLDSNNQASTTFNALTTGSGDDLGVVARVISQSDFDCDDVGVNRVSVFFGRYWRTTCGLRRFRYYYRS